MPIHSNADSKEIVLNDREQIQYLLGNPPTWMMRYGISVIFSCVVLALILSYFIQFPDVLEVNVSLTTSNPPIRVLAQTSGSISDLLVKDHQVVKKGQVIAVLENTANWQDVLRLEEWLKRYGNNQDNLLPDLQLGGLQSSYSVFSQHWKDYHYFSTSPNTAERIAALQSEIEHLEKMNGSLSRQNALLNEEFALNNQEIKRQRQLHTDHIISDREFEKSETILLQLKRQIESGEAAKLQNQMQIQQSKNQINELRLSKSDNQNEKELTLEEDYQRLLSALAEWKQIYIIAAPIPGKVSLSKVWSSKQNVSSGEEVLAIIPENDEQTKIIGKASIPSQNIGKLKQGNRAIIRLDAYPAQQYGSIEGIVSNIATLPQEEGYLIDIDFPNGMTTSYDKTIPFRQEMVGHGRAITEDRRILERIFDRLNDLLKNE